MHTISAATIDIFPAIFSLFCKLCLALNKTFQSRFFNIHKTRIRKMSFQWGKPNTNLRIEATSDALLSSSRIKSYWTKEALCSSVLKSLEMSDWLPEFTVLFCNWFLATVHTHCHRPGLFLPSSPFRKQNNNTTHCSQSASRNFSGLITEMRISRQRLI
jgi:hypothetical protein